LQYFSTLGHGKNVAQSFVNKIPLKNVQNSRIIVSDGFDNGQKEIQKYVVTKEEIIFVAVGRLK